MKTGRKEGSKEGRKEGRKGLGNVASVKERKNNTSNSNITYI